MQRALLIGINQYENAGIVKQLQGCVQDVADMQSLILQHCNFKTADITFLQDSQATKNKIEIALRDFVNGVKAGDRLLFHNSGHGSYCEYTDQMSGKVVSIEDGIVPFDYQCTCNSLLLASELKSYLSQLPPEIEFTWVADTCYSGGLKWANTLNTKKRTKFAPPARQWVNDERMRVHPLSMFDISVAIPGALLAACKADQLSNDRPGSFTAELMQELSAPGGLTRSLRQVFDVAAKNTTAAHPEQEPQIFGPAVTQSRPFMKFR